MCFHNSKFEGGSKIPQLSGLSRFGPLRSHNSVLHLGSLAVAVALVVDFQSILPTNVPCVWKEESLSTKFAPIDRAMESKFMFFRGDKHCCGASLFFFMTFADPLISARDVDVIL